MEEDVELKEENRNSKKKKIMLWGSLVLALLLLTVALLLIFLLPKGEKYYIETNSSLEVVLEGQGEYAEGEEVTIKAEDIEGYRFRNWTLNGIEVSKELEYTFKASDETDGTYTANYDKLFKITIANVENGSIITNITEAIEGEEVEIEVSPNVEYMLGEIYYIVEGTSVRVDIVDNKFNMPLGNVTIYATFVEELYNVETNVENGEIVLTSDRVSPNDTVEFTVKTNPLEEDYAYVVNRVYYKVNGDSQEHEITKNDGVYSFTMPSANVTIHAEIEKIVRYSGFTFLEEGNTSTIANYTGSKTELVIPGSYSKRTIDVEANAPKPVTFNTVEEFEEYMSSDENKTIVMSGFFYITTPLTERTFVKDVQTYMDELGVLAGEDATKAFPMTIEFVDYELSYEDILSLETAQTALLRSVYEIMLGQSSNVTISFNSGETFNIDATNYLVEIMNMAELLNELNENMFPVKVSYGGKATIYTEGDDYIVTSIDGYDLNGFGDSKIKKVKIPATIERIFAFRGPDTLEEVIFEEGSRLESISYYCFNSPRLTSIDLPSSLTSIGWGAFEGSGLTYLDLSNTQISSIDSEVFSNCSSLTSIEIPSSLTSISDSAFSGCYALAEVYNYSNIIITKGSNDYGYVGCYAKVVYNASDLMGEKPESRIQIIDNVQYYVYEEDFIALAPLVSRDLLIELKLDSRTTGINQYAFYEYSSLTTVTFGENSHLTSIGDYAFRDCSNLISIKIPSSVTSIGDYAFFGCSFTNIEIPSSVASIGNSAFSFCSSLTTVIIEENSQLINIGDYAFDACSSLTTVIIEKNSQIISIGGMAFFRCQSLISIEIPSSVTSIGDMAFSGCSNLTTVTIDSAEIYNDLTSNTSCEYLIENAETIKVLKSVVDNPENINTYLNNESNFTKTEEGDYYVYTVVVA